MTGSGLSGIYTLADFNNPVNSDEARADYLHTLGNNIAYNPAHEFTTLALDFISAGLGHNNSLVYEAACGAISKLAPHANLESPLLKSKLKSIALQLERKSRLDENLATSVLGNLLEHAPDLADTPVPLASRTHDNILVPPVSIVRTPIIRAMNFFSLDSHDDKKSKLIPALSRPTLIDNLIVTALGARDGRYCNVYTAQESLKKLLRVASKHLKTTRRIVGEAKSSFKEIEAVRRICEDISKERLTLMPAEQVDAVLNDITTSGTQESGLETTTPSQVKFAGAEIASPEPPTQLPAALPAENKNEDILTLMQRANEEVLRRNIEKVALGKSDPQIDAAITAASANLIALAQMPEEGKNRLRGDSPQP